MVSPLPVAAIVFALGIAAGAGCRFETSREKEVRFLGEFLAGPADDGWVTQAELEPLLYDVKLAGKTSGRALDMGRGFYLTAFHVVDGHDQGIFLTPQTKRDKGESIAFELAAFDVNSDLALLKTPSAVPDGPPAIGLDAAAPRPGEEVAKLIGLIGKPPRSDFKLVWSGVDFYDQKKQVPDLGTLAMAAGSLIYEVRGKVLPFDARFGKKLFAGYRRNKKTRRLTSILTYNGDSGSPVFRYRPGKGYKLAGVITHSYGIGHEFPTPGHPLGYKGMEQAGGVISIRPAVERLLHDYLLKTADLPPVGGG